MSIVIRMVTVARSAIDFPSEERLDVGFRAALRAIKPEDVSDGMVDIFEERFLNHINMNAPNSRDDLRRAIAAAIAAGGEQ